MIYGLAKRLTAIGVGTRVRLRVEGAENVPRKGAAIVASNHMSALDPPLVGMSISRTVHFMGKAELFESFWLGMLFRAILVIPVHRGFGDREAIRSSLNVLEKGGLLGIFPEGTRSRSEELQKFHGGAALLAIKSRAPIVPAAVLGTGPQPLDGSGFRRLAIVRLGRPILPEAEASTTSGGRKGRVKKEEITALSGRLSDAILALRNN